MMPLPLVDRGAVVAVIVSAENLDEAARRAVEERGRWLVATGVDINDASMLVSCAGDIRVFQIVDPLVTCRTEMPKRILSRIGIRLLDPAG